METYVKWFLCHHSMMHPQVVHVDSLQIWRVAENIFNKLSWQLTELGPVSWRLWITPLHKKLACYEKLQMAFDLNISFDMMQYQMDRRFGISNVKSLCRLNSLKTVARELAKLSRI
jgi:hypothetical protein